MDNQPVRILPLPAVKGWGRGFGVFNMVCGNCGYQWIAVTAIGTHGAECPACHKVNKDVVWSATGEMPNDGCWLTPYLYGDFG